MEETLKLAERYGFQTGIVNDAVGYAQWGTAEEYLGIIGHLDVVPEGSGWSVPPFQLTKNQRLYGRGILDNKGPILALPVWNEITERTWLPTKENHSLNVWHG